MAEAKHKSVRLTTDEQALLQTVADLYYSGNQTEAIKAGVLSLFEKEALIKQLVKQCWDALDIDGMYDPSDDDRIEQPAGALASLIGKSEMQGIVSALREIRYQQLMKGIE